MVFPRRWTVGFPGLEYFSRHAESEAVEVDMVQGGGCSPGRTIRNAGRQAYGLDAKGLNATWRKKR